MTQVAGGNCGYLGVEDPEASPWLPTRAFAVPGLHSNHLCHGVQLPNCLRTATSQDAQDPTSFPWPLKHCGAILLLRSDCPRLPGQ